MNAWSACTATIDTVGSRQRGSLGHAGCSWARLLPARTSAPAGLAVRVAEAAGLALIDVAGPDAFEVFTHPDHIKPGPPLSGQRAQPAHDYANDEINDQQH
jgi:hypothetical protein